MKKSKITALFILLFFSAIIAAGAFYIYQQLQPVSVTNTADTDTTSENYRLKVPSGSTVYSVSKDLKKNGIIKSDKVFYYAARLLKKEIKAGIYKVNTKMSPLEILNLLESGKQEFITVNIPEGQTLRQIAAQLERLEVTEKDAFINTCYDKNLLAEYKIPGESFEGYLFPDTYNFVPETAAFTVLRTMVNNFFTKISGIPELADLSPEDLFYKVRLASVIEKEYRLEEEAPLIASVFTNRLKINQGLYSCATVVYILTDILGRPHPDSVTIADTRIDSPYNTYLYAGLPPGAISNPGLTALNAAAKPAKTKYRYFRLIDEEKGKHVFSVDFEDHIEAGKTIYRTKK